MLQTHLGENNNTRHCYAHAVETPLKRTYKNASKPVFIPSTISFNIQKHSTNQK